MGNETNKEHKQHKYSTQSILQQQHKNHGTRGRRVKMYDRSKQIEQHADGIGYILFYYNSTARKSTITEIATEFCEFLLPQRIRNG